MSRYEYFANLNTQNPSEVMAAIADKLGSSTNFKVLYFNNGDEIGLQFSSHSGHAHDPNDDPEDAIILLGEDKLIIIVRSATEQERRTFISELQKIIALFDYAAHLEER